MEFYNIKKKERVHIDEAYVWKTVFADENRERYAIRATDDDGSTLTRFVSKTAYDNLDVPEE